MPGVTSVPRVDGTAARGVELTPLQAVDPSMLVDAPAPIRGLAAFAFVAALGGLLLWRFEPFVDRSIAASMDRPFSSLGYGMAAHAVIAFGGIYLADQLGQSGALGPTGTAIGLTAGLLVVLLAGSLGFTVVGTTMVALAWEGQRGYGVLAGAAVAGVAGALDPLVGGLVWFVVVSMGIGGPARRWLHADLVDDL